MIGIIQYIKENGYKPFLIADLLEAGYITNNMRNNATHLRYHRLIKKIGHAKWEVTDKGVDFYRGRKIPKTVVRKKSTGEVIGYTGEVCIDQYLSKTEHQFQQRKMYAQPQ